MPRLSAFASALGTAITLVACSTPSETPAAATVYFVLDAPLCSSQLAMQFEIDHVSVGADTFRVNLSPNRTRSRAFTVKPGDHTLSARVVGGYVWPDTVVRLVSGAVVNDSLPFYCS